MRVFSGCRESARPPRSRSVARRARRCARCARPCRDSRNRRRCTAARDRSAPRGLTAHGSACRRPSPALGPPASGRRKRPGSSSPRGRARRDLRSRSPGPVPRCRPARSTPSSDRSPSVGWSPTGVRHSDMAAAQRHGTLLQRGQRESECLHCLPDPIARGDHAFATEKRPDLPHTPRRDAFHARLDRGNELLRRGPGPWPRRARRRCACVVPRIPGLVVRCREIPNASQICDRLATPAEVSRLI